VKGRLFDRFVDASKSIKVSKEWEGLEDIFPNCPFTRDDEELGKKPS
jgi:hypothetical protein